MSKREVVLKHVTHIIGNGHNTDTWCDPCLPGGRIRDIYGDKRAMTWAWVIGAKSLC